MKNYFCKDCLENNNGWCNLHKKQGLKAITSCNDKRTEYTTDSNKEIDTRGSEAIFRVIGKREMFQTIQSQMLAIDSDPSIDDRFIALKQVMVNLEQMLNVHEQLFEVDKYTNSEIDRGIREDSKKISQYWLNIVGDYKKEGR